MTLVLLSGGLDSTVLATQLVRAHGNTSVLSLSVNYGQRHDRELLAAAQVAASLDIEHLTINLSGLGAHLSSALTPASDSGTIPHGHYAEPNMAQTVVPNRNAILLMIAVGIAQGRGHTNVATAVHSGDHPVYPDCRPEFIATADTTARAGTGGAVSISAPFLSRTKTDIARLSLDVQAPVHLSWSCYEGGTVHCGRCGTCVERAEAFHTAKVADPTTYADPHYWTTATGASA